MPLYTFRICLLTSYVFWTDSGTRTESTHPIFESGLHYAMANDFHKFIQFCCLQKCLFFFFNKFSEHLPFRVISGSLVGMTPLDISLSDGLPRWLSGKDTACQFRRQERWRFYPWVRKIPWRRAWQPTLVFLPGKSHGQRSLAGYSPWGRKELNTTEHAHLLCFCLV